jgi:hypothetical protein
MLKKKCGQKKKRERDGPLRLGQQAWKKAHELACMQTPVALSRNQQQWLHL